MNNYFILKICATTIFAYLTGSIPFGVIFAKIFANEDVREKKSRNIGATNVLRVAGIIPASLTLAGDMLKGAVPVLIACSCAGCNNNVPGKIAITIVGLFAFLGHLYPIYTKFKCGGKGVATAAGCIFVISPETGLMSMLIFIILIFFYNRVSAASLGAAAALPVLLWLFEHSLILSGYAFITGVLIFHRHADNIKRLLAGTEPTLKNKIEQKK